MKKIAFLSLAFVMVFAFVGSVSAASINSLSDGSTIALGQGDVAINGTCTGSTLSIPIVLTQGSHSTQVGTGTTPDNGLAGSFNALGYFPLNVDDGFTTGAATITAVCPEGNASVAITLIDPDPAGTSTPTPTPTPSPTPTPTPTPSPSPSTGTGTDSGDVGGVSTTPEGGVAAGLSGLDAIEWSVLAVILMGVSGWLFVRKSPVTDLTA